MNRVSAIILGAGFASRFGSSKLESAIGDRSVLEATVGEVRRADPYEIVLVCQRPSAVEGVVEIINPQPEDGLGSSIALGVKAANGNRFLIVLGDMPLVPASHYLTLMDRQDSIVITGCDTYEGVPAIFDECFRADLEGLQNDRGARSIWKDLAPEVVQAESDWLVDIDTENDLEKVRDLLRRKAGEEDL